MDQQHRPRRQGYGGQPGRPVAFDVPERREIGPVGVQDLPAERGRVEPGVAERLPVLAAVLEPLAGGAEEPRRRYDNRLASPIAKRSGESSSKLGRTDPVEQDARTARQVDESGDPGGEGGR